MPLFWPFYGPNACPGGFPSHLSPADGKFLQVTGGDAELQEKGEHDL